MEAVSTNPNYKTNNEENSVEKVLRDAKGMASSLSLRLSNWWSAILPVSQEPTTPSQATFANGLESKSIEALRSSWYSEHEKKRLSSQSSLSVSASSQPCEAESVRIWLLGRSFKVTAENLADSHYAVLQPLLEDFRAQPWFTYRHHFPPLKPSSFSTDSGWGCMLRSGQCLLGQALFRKELGRDWSLKDLKDEEISRIYVQTMVWFLDEMSLRSPYSIHRIALLGKQFDKEIGEWFGPYTMAHVMKSLVLDHKELDLNVYVNADGAVYKSEILSPSLAVSAYADKATISSAQASPEPSHFSPTLILLPIRLGVNTFNPIYHTALKSYFGFPQIVGIAGGKPSSSLFFVGFEDDNLIYLDPHHARPSVPEKVYEDYTVEDFTSYHCDTPRKLNIEHLDPCMLIGFYCDTKEDFLDFCQRSEELATHITPIFRVFEKTPIYLDDLNLEPDSDDIEF